MSGSQFPETDAYQPQAPNIIGMYQQAAGLKGQLNQNQQFAAQSAQSKLLANAATNSDGTIDPQAYKNAIAANPTAASYGAGDAFAQAQDINQKLIANTGQSLAQHITRNTMLYNDLKAISTNSNGQGVTASQYKDGILDALAKGHITPQDATAAYTGVSNDPMANEKLVDQNLAAVTNSLAAFTPVYNTFTSGGQNLTVNTNPNALGGSKAPSTSLNAPSPSELLTPQSWTDSNGVKHQGTEGNYAAAQGISTAGGFGSPVQGGNAPPQQGGSPPPQQSPVPPPVNQAPLPQIGPQTPNALGGGNAAPGPLAGGAVSPPGAPAPSAVPGQGGTPIAGMQPGLAEVQTASAQSYNDDQAAAKAIPQALSSLREVLAAAPGAQTGPGAGQFATLRALGAELGVNVGTDQASQEQVMNKATTTLSSASMTGMGTETDAKLLAAFNMTPNSSMTEDAVKTAGAMTYGNLAYKQGLASAASQWVANGGAPGNYPQFIQHYQASHPSPLILSMPMMDAPERQTMVKFIKTLPANQQKSLEAQYQAMQASNGPSQ